MVLRKKMILVILLSVLALQGCATLKGAAAGASAGFKEDMEAVKRLDSWMHEHMW